MNDTVKKALIFCLIGAFGMAITMFGVALGLIEMARYSPAKADELLAHVSDKQQPAADSTLQSTTLPATSRNITGNPAGGANLDDATTREDKTDHFNEQKRETNKMSNGGVMQNPAAAVQDMDTVEKQQ